MQIIFVVALLTASFANTSLAHPTAKIRSFEDTFRQDYEAHGVAIDRGDIPSCSIFRDHWPAYPILDKRSFEDDLIRNYRGHSAAILDRGDLHPVIQWDPQWLSDLL